MIEFTYDEITGRLWADHFEGFCEGLRDLCGLDLDVKRSNVSMATYYQEYSIGGKLHGVERDDMPKFLTQLGVANDETRSRANPSNWILYLTEKEGLADTFESLFVQSVSGAGYQQGRDIEDIVDSVFVETNAVADEAVEDIEPVVAPSADEKCEDTQEGAEEEEGVTETINIDEPLVETTVPTLEPDFDYIKSLKDSDDAVELLKEYGVKFGIEVAGTNFKGCNISFRNKWKRMQKEANKV